jgi:hypothetical protein
VFSQSGISTVEQDTNSLIKLKKVAGANRVYSLLFLPVGLTVHLVDGRPIVLPTLLWREQRCFRNKLHGEEARPERIEVF